MILLLIERAKIVWDYCMVRGARYVYSTVSIIHASNWAKKWKWQYSINNTVIVFSLVRLNWLYLRLEYLDVEWLIILDIMCQPFSNVRLDGSKGPSGNRHSRPLCLSTSFVGVDHHHPTYLSWLTQTRWGKAHLIIAELFSQSIYDHRSGRHSAGHEESVGIYSRSTRGPQRAPPGGVGCYALSFEPDCKVYRCISDTSFVVRVVSKLLFCTVQLWGCWDPPTAPKSRAYSHPCQMGVLTSTLLWCVRPIFWWSVLHPTRKAHAWWGSYARCSPSASYLRGATKGTSSDCCSSSRTGSG